MTSTRDADVLARIADALASSNEFAEVVAGRLPDPPPTEGLYPRAWIRFDRWSERSLGDPEVKRRDVQFSLTISTRAGFDAESELDRLACLAQDVLEGSDFGGLCLPPSSLVSDGRFAPYFGAVTAGTARAAELAVILTVRAAYLIDGYRGPGNNPADFDPDAPAVNPFPFPLA